jgi:hypothetical protein
MKVMKAIVFDFTLQSLVLRVEFINYLRQIFEKETVSCDAI